MSIAIHVERGQDEHGNAIIYPDRNNEAMEIDEYCKGKEKTKTIHVTTELIYIWEKTTRMKYTQESKKEGNKILSNSKLYTVFEGAARFLFQS